MPDETFADRLAALKDIVPPTYRKHLSNTLSTWALAFAEEQQMAEMEREMKMQQSANEVRLATHIDRGQEHIANGEFTASHSTATVAGQARSVNGHVCSFLHRCCHAHVSKMPFFLLPCTTISLGGGGSWIKRNAIDSTNSSFCSFRVQAPQYRFRTATRASCSWHEIVHVWEKTLLNM
jgi:hypothetical protein